MAKRSRARVRGGAHQPRELGLQGKGVEAIVIREIETAANAFKKSSDDLAPFQETYDDTRKKLMDVMKKHEAELVKEVKGGFSYKYGDRLVKLKLGTESVVVVSAHDMPAVTVEAGD